MKKGFYAAYTPISLAQATAALLTIEPTIDRAVMMNIVLEMESEVGEAFLQCDNLQNEELEPGETK